MSDFVDVEQHELGRGMFVLPHKKGEVGEITSVVKDGKVVFSYTLTYPDGREQSFVPAMFSKIKALASEYEY